MSQLLRIILIHGHLPGVVELDVQGHTNICGTNASGKTTLQRLIPVFYGEQPNKVVPKTRDRFDVFYLPYDNSYLVYEYQRGDQQYAQVVLTKRGDGVDYRFVDAPYKPEQYLQAASQGALAMSYSAWTQTLRQQGIECSHKISATSEYRSIIQNDLGNVRGGRKDSIRLRQLAARFALVQGSQRLRHIEKLVSAVHAKEGKMDTLKSMLATILEEDGYKRPQNTLKAAKIRAWTQEMRQYMRMDNLQQQYEAVGEVRVGLAASVHQLSQLQPALMADASRLKTDIADMDARWHQLKGERQQRRVEYEQNRDSLLDEMSELRAQLKQTQSALEDAEQRRDQFDEEAMATLTRDTQRLPQLQTQLDERAEHLQLLMDKHADAAHKLSERQHQLATALDRMQRKQQEKMSALREQQAQVRAQQETRIAELQQHWMEEQTATQRQFHERAQALHSECAEKETQLTLSPLTADEHEAMQLADMRIEQCQDALQHTQQGLEREQQQLATQQQARQQADHVLTQARRAEREAQQSLDAVHTQLTPEADSLRDFLRQQLPGWEQTLGKVIAQPLLARTDLHPRLSDQAQHQLMGVELDLSALELPPYAQEESALQAQVKAAQAALDDALAQRNQVEQQLEQTQQAYQQQEQALQQARQKRKRAQQDLDYAREAKKSLMDEYRALHTQRHQSLQARVQVLHTQQAQVRDEERAALADLRHQFKALELELRADFQAQLQDLEEAIADHQLQIDDKRADMQAQIKELEQTFNQDLAEHGVDPQRLAALKQEQSDLRQHIQSIKEGQQTLRDYQDFMRVVWNQHRPDWLQTQQQLETRLQQAEQAKAELKRAFEASRQDSEQAVGALESNLDKSRGQLKEVEQQLDALSRIIGLPAMAADNADLQQGGLAERVQRARQTLLEQRRYSEQLQQRCEALEADINRYASDGVAELMAREIEQLETAQDYMQRSDVLGKVLSILRGQQMQVVDQGMTIGDTLSKFFTVFSNLNRRVDQYSQRLTEVVGDELSLEGISRSEVVIGSTIDELGFWQPLQKLTGLYQDWRASGDLLPDEEYLQCLADVADLLRADQDYNLESLLKLELHMQEGSTQLVIRNDRQLLESSSHGMAYLILCKFLLAFTRLLRGDAAVILHWPIDEIGTLAYHNVEKLFAACDSNQIHVVGAFPNPESDVLMLFQQRYLIEPHPQHAGKGQLKRIQPRVSALAAKLQSSLAKQDARTVDEVNL